MSLLYADSMDGATLGAGLGDNYLTAQGYGGAGAGDAVAGRGATGVAIYNLQGVYTRTVSSISSGTGIYVGAAIKVDSGTGDQLGFQLSNGSGVQLTLYIDRDDRSVALYRGTSAGTLLVSGSAASFEFGTWFYLEMKVKVHDTAGYAQLRIGEAMVALELTEGDTQNQAAGTVTLIGFQFPNCYIDDFYTLDDTGDAPLNDFLGDGSFSAPPTGDAVAFEDFTGAYGDPARRQDARNDVLARGLYAR